jgi:hypothetical protein
MSKRLNKFLLEIDENREFKQLVCLHGGVKYPSYWAEKTQVKAINDGFMTICAICEKESQRFVKLTKEGEVLLVAAKKHKQ